MFQVRGLDLSLFQNPRKLHLTIGTLRLYSGKEEVSSHNDEAIKLVVIEFLNSGLSKSQMFKFGLIDSLFILMVNQAF